MDLLKLTALELGRKIKAGEVTVREAVRAVIEQAKEVEPTINSYVTLHVVSCPSIHILSLIATGTPASGPVSSPASIFF